ncbi:MAG: hypothetical protein Unbinned3818contig1000_5 [Prokaryotic dsDNA virus sp.]|nr:hypothetical protein [Phycisphaerae bacterium]QDP45934.1 MAG: hypothetical protein Unbinned3818contig1000_5 [Prokaryotic dsDNA virus sp.]|tara:strand:- start:392 stop:586 length:195 start_codon:yes stop_codon:yes gene_type:complete
MKISTIIKKLIEFDEVERPAYVYLFERDNEGNVISKKRYPIEAVFSHEGSEAKICIEQSACVNA